MSSPASKALHERLESYLPELDNDKEFTKEFKLTKDGKCAYRDVDIGNGERVRVLLVGVGSLSDVKRKEILARFDEAQISKIAACAQKIFGGKGQKYSGYILAFENNDVVMVKTPKEKDKERKIKKLDKDYYDKKAIKHEQSAEKKEKYKTRETSIQELNDIFKACLN